MDIGTPPPPPPPPPYVGVTPTTTTTTAATNSPPIYNNGGIAANIPQIPHHNHHSSSGSSLIIVMIVISSAIIVSATVYLFIRFLSRRCNRSFRTMFSDISPADDVVSDNRNENENVRHHVISISNNETDSLPLFRFSSLTGKIAGGDCAVCLSKFEGVDQLRLLPLCCHAFHAECIDAWLKSNQTCPLCRSTVNPTEDDVLNKIASATAGGGGRGGGNRSNSFRIEIGNVSQRRDREPSDSDRRSYSIGSYEYVLDDGYEISVESTHRRGGSDCTSVDKDSIAPEPPGYNLAAEVGAGGGSGRRNWLRDYVDRVSVSLSSRTQSLRGSGSLRRSDTVDDFEASHGRVGEEISELFRWLSGV